MCIFADDASMHHECDIVVSYVNALMYSCSGNHRYHKAVMCVGSYSSFDVIPSKSTRASAVRTSANRFCSVCNKFSPYLSRAFLIQSAYS